MLTQDTRAPQSGDILILIDGRRFVIDSVDQSSRGWWFKARAQDESCVLQGNLRLRWNVVARAWCPQEAGSESAPTSPLPFSMQRPSQPRAQQID